MTIPSGSSSEAAPVQAVHRLDAGRQVSAHRLPRHEPGPHHGLAGVLGRQIAQMMHYSAVGAPEHVAEYLDEFARIAGADETWTETWQPTEADWAAVEARLGEAVEELAAIRTQHELPASCD